MPSREERRSERKGGPAYWISDDFSQSNPSFQLLCFPFGNDLSFSQEGNTIAQELGLIHLVGCQNDGQAIFPVDLFQTHTNGFRDLRIEANRGFVQKENSEDC